MTHYDLTTPLKEFNIPYTKATITQSERENLLRWYQLYRRTNNFAPVKLFLEKLGIQYNTAPVHVESLIMGGRGFTNED
ncbi:hypothetical protein [Vibrio gallicus]|uniref:hypothetical protein n=1 Tax=Vibrio gallicus TaxID=190897 RepID=UPI0021C2BE75|nr:hypothetical protein [Vibrio gallicus]